MCFHLLRGATTREENQHIQENSFNRISTTDGTDLVDVIAVEHGLDFTVVLKKDGTVWG